MRDPAAISQASDPSRWQLDPVAAFIRSCSETAAEHVDLSDFELEQWFARHRLEIINLVSLDVVPFAPWLHAIGPPANDNDG